jgi:hypothetical protein
MSQDTQQLIVWGLLAGAAVGVLCMAARSIRALVRGKCASRCSGCQSANDAATPHDVQSATTENPKQRVVFLPASNLRNSSRDQR